MKSCCCNRSCSRKDRTIWDAVILVGIASALCSVAVILLKLREQHQFTNPSTPFNNNNNNGTNNMNETTSELASQNIRIIFIGNSMMSRNDCPGVVSGIIRQAGNTLTSTVCLRNGATLSSIWNNDRGCFEGQFSSNTINYVVMNDHSQSPARSSSRAATVNILKSKYAPLFNTNGGGTSRPPIPILIQTPAYRQEGIQDSGDLGSFDQFTNLLSEGLRQYRKALSSLLSSGSRVAAVGDAFRVVRNKDRAMFDKLYNSDNFHLSPHGTWLQSCMIYITAFNKRPSTSTAKISKTDAETLLQIACDVTGGCR
jgi:hypothetical protein